MSQSAARRLALAAALLGTGFARANDPEASALILADEAPGVVAKAGDWRNFVEGAYGGTVKRSDGATKYTRRLSLDIQYDHSFSREWRAVLADRLDVSWPAEDGADSSINTLKEAYLSWRTQSEAILDLGRINVRNGVAIGYNPTDYFRAGASRSIVSINPSSLKENRQGSIMLRGQRLWESGALTALYSPELSRHTSPEGLSLDAGETNPRNRWLVAVSQKIGGSLTPQFLIYREEELPMQFGLNLTGLINDATVAYLEWSGGRSSPLLTQVRKDWVPTRSEHAWRNHLATGLTYTTPNRISLTAEYQYNGSGLDETAWEALQRGPLAIYGRYRSWVQTVQELPTKQALFLYATWQDALINRLDFSVMHNVDVIDSSRRTWLEARYHVGDVEYAVQWQCHGGRPLTHFGAMPDSRSWQAVIRYYL